MSRRIDRELFRAAATAHLQPAEQISGIFGALISHQFTSGLVIASGLALLMRLMDHATWRHKARCYRPYLGTNR